MRRFSSMRWALLICLSTDAIRAEQLPMITQQPEHQILVEGQDLRLSVEAEGEPLEFQWRFNTVPLTGETKPQLHRPNLPLDQSGSYDVVVRNAHGTVLSRVAIVQFRYRGGTVLFDNQPSRPDPQAGRISAVPGEAIYLPAEIIWPNSGRVSLTR